jgi:DHA2 family methylenomycin A resistance protein-like MFS transporter
MWLTLRIDGHISDHGSRRLDLPGQLSAVLAMILLNAALIEGGRVGWSNSWILAALVLSALATLSFVIIERRSGSPILPLSLFSNPVFSWICVTVLLSSATFFGMLFVLGLYFLQGAGYTPLQTGLAMLPFALLATAGNLASARLAGRISPMSLMLAGSAVRLIGFAGLAVGGADVCYPLMALELGLMGFGSGLGNPMTISVLISTVDRKYSGVASGISRATGQLGSAIGVAIFGAFLADPHHISDGTRLVASISTASTVFVTLVIWHVWQQRDRTA